MLHHVLPQVVSYPVSIPAVHRQQPLHPVGRGVASIFRQLPPILALHRTQQSLQVGQSSLPRLAAAKAARDTLVQCLEPPAHSSTSSGSSTVWPITNPSTLSNNHGLNLSHNLRL